MKESRLLWTALTIGAAVLAQSAPAASTPHPASDKSKSEVKLSVCFGTYAICAKATCKRTVVDGKEKAQCECPVLVGAALADLRLLETGSCTPPPGSIYSLFSTCEPPDVTAGVMECPAGAFAQCWNAPCTYKAGARSATCICPIETRAFTTPGGECNPGNCSKELLVGAGVSLQPTCPQPSPAAVSKGE